MESGSKEHTESCLVVSERAEIDGVDGLTRHHITGVHSVFIFNEAKAVHQLDVGNLPRSVGVEVILDILFGNYIARIVMSAVRISSIKC